MSGIEVAAIGAAVGGAALSATSNVMRGREESRAAQFEQEQLQIREQTTKTAAMQDEAARRRELTSNLETIQAIRSGRGVAAGSPTGTAILDSTIANEERDIGIMKSNAGTAADLARRGGIMAGERAKTSLLAGYLGAGSDILSGVSRGANIYSYGRATPGRR